MNKLSQIFMYEGHQIRTVVINGQPHWVGKDVCDILEIGNASDALKRLDDDERTLVSIEGASNGLPVNVVTESGLYSLILGSKKPEAKPFKRWVTHEVLPTIRKTGTYNIEPEKPSYMLDDPIARASKWIEEMKHTQMLEQQNAHKDEMLKLQEPKVALYDVAMAADGVQPVGTVAKELGLGRTRLFAILRDKKVLRQNNEPYQEYIERGYFKLRMYTITHKTSGLENKTQPMVTAKGVAWLHKMLKEA